MGNLISACHKVEMVVRGSSEGTNHYECLECNMPCNILDTTPADVYINGASTAAHFASTTEAERFIDNLKKTSGGKQDVSQATPVAPLNKEELREHLEEILDVVSAFSSDHGFYPHEGKLLPAAQNVEEALAQILALLNSHIREARIDELKRIPTKVQPYTDMRIAALENEEE